jgi:hypothetical protein
MFTRSQRVGLVSLMVFATSARADTDAESEAKADQQMASSIGEVNQTCKSTIKVVMDWPSFRLGYTQLDPDPMTPPPMRAAQKCSEVVSRVGDLCRNSIGQAAVAASLKTIKCALEPKQPHKGSLKQELKDGTYAVTYTWFTSDLEVRLYLDRLLPAQPANAWHWSVAEAQDTPKIDSEITESMDNFNERQKTSFSAAIDWPSFHAVYAVRPGSLRSSSLKAYFEDFMEALLGCWRGLSAVEQKKFRATVKKVALANDPALTKAVDFEVKNGTLTMKCNLSNPEKIPTGTKTPYNTYDFLKAFLAKGGLSGRR